MPFIYWLVLKRSFEKELIKHFFPVFNKVVIISWKNHYKIVCRITYLKVVHFKMICRIKEFFFCLKGERIRIFI